MAEASSSMVSLRQARSSRMMARADLRFALIDDPDGQRIGFQGLVPLSVEWERNSAGEADTAKLTFSGDVLPFDLGIMAAKSVTVSLWLFEHQAPERCRTGDPGHFFGVVDQIRRDRYTLEVSMDARDLTAIPLGSKMPEDLVKTFSVAGKSVHEIVEALIRQIPNTHSWSVESRTPAAESTHREQVARLERTKVPPTIKPVRATKTARPARKVIDTRAVFLADIVPPHELTVWSAIANVCARNGVVPEVMLDRAGDPMIVLVDGQELATTDILRPFRRGNRSWRVLVDGDGISTFSESLSIEPSEARPDYVQVDSRDPLTGARVSARYPPELNPKPKREERGLFQFVRGETEAACARMAKAGFESLAHNQFRVSVTVPEPWSAGGGPEDPDLLDLGYGAALEIATPAFNRLATVDGVSTPEQILEARGVDRGQIGRILLAQERLGAMALLFQVVGVRHSWSGGTAPGYTCEIGLRRFLGTETMPIVVKDVPPARGYA